MRTDPSTIYAARADLAAGLEPIEIAARHNLPLLTVRGFLQTVDIPTALLSPYDLHHEPDGQHTRIQIYWLGYVAASGKVVGQGTSCTLILAIHPQDEQHVDALLRDLATGHSHSEIVDSSLEGRQVYIRDRRLAETLLHWGMGQQVNEHVLPMDFVPISHIMDFVRGYLEGSRGTPPFGGIREELPIPRSVRTLVVQGAARIIDGLRRVLSVSCHTDMGVITRAPDTGLAQLKLSPKDSALVLSRAYAEPIRTSPRAARFVQEFAGDAPAH